MRCITCFVLGFVAQVTGIRIGDNPIVLDQGTDEAACVTKLKEVQESLTLNRLFKFVLEGRYRIRNRYSGKYLTAHTDGDKLRTSRAYVDSSGFSLWDIRKVKDTEGFPKYTLSNKHFGRNLARGGDSSLTVKGEKRDAAWYLEPSHEGIYNVISFDEEGAERLVEDTKTTFVEIGAKASTEYENWKSSWELELVGKPAGRWVPRKSRGEYRFQWKQASTVPMFKGGTFTWADMCEEAGQADTCPDGYADIRQYYLSVGTVSETGGNNIPTEADIGQCGMPIGMGKQMYSLPELVKEVKGLAGESCPADYDLRTISRLMRQGIEELCYSSCLADIDLAISSFDCAASNADNWNNFGAKVFDDMTQCKGVSPTTLLYLIDFSLQKHCWQFVAPSPLWLPQDNGPGTTNLAKADEDPVCGIKEGKESSRALEAIVQPAGRHCIEGTSCGCPSTWRKKYTSLAEKRTAASLSAGNHRVSHSSLPATSTPNFFIADSDIGLQNVLNTMSKSMFIGTLVGVTIKGLTFKTALLATPFGAPFMIQTGIALFGYMKHAVTWTCAESAGCWPQEPKRVRTKQQSKACRLPDETKSGGSKVWFMPPPGFKLFHRGFWSFRKCALKFCSKSDMLAQRIEFGEDKRNIYNCQPLPYDEMTETQKGLYEAELRKTIPEEYAEEF